MNIRKLSITFIILNSCLIFFLHSQLFAFPLRNVHVGSKFEYSNLMSIFNEYDKLISLNKNKAILIWRASKSNSKRIFIDFYKVCKEKSIPCISIELDGIDKEEILKLVKDEGYENISLVRDTGNIVKEFGIFTLPVTIFLNQKNEILDAVGFEGQFYDKMSKYIDYITGKITKEEYEKSGDSELIDRKISLMPKINFIKKLINSSKKDEAIKELQSLNLEGISDIEYIKLAEIYIKIEDYQKATEMLNKTKINDVSAKYYKGLLLYKVGNFNESLSILKSIENIYPNKKDIYSLIGKLYLKLGDYKNSAEYYDKIIDF